MYAIKRTRNFSLCIFPPGSTDARSMTWSDTSVYWFRWLGCFSRSCGSEVTGETCEQVPESRIYIPLVDAESFQGGKGKLNMADVVRLKIDGIRFLAATELTVLSCCTKSILVHSNVKMWWQCFLGSAYSCSGKSITINHHEIELPTIFIAVIDIFQCSRTSKLPMVSEQYYMW